MIKALHLRPSVLRRHSPPHKKNNNPLRMGMQGKSVARGRIFRYGWRMMIGAEEAARRLGVTSSAMRRWRKLGLGPPYEWHCGRARYDEAAIAARAAFPEESR